MVVALDGTVLLVVALRRATLGEDRCHDRRHGDRHQEGEQRRAAPPDHDAVDERATEVGEHVEKAPEHGIRAAVRAVEKGALGGAHAGLPILGVQIGVVGGEQRVGHLVHAGVAGVGAGPAPMAARPGLGHARRLERRLVEREQAERQGRWHAAREHAHHEARQRRPQERQRHAQRDVRRTECWRAGGPGRAA